MNFFPYLFMLTLASIIHFNMSNYISSFGHGHMQSKTSNLLSKGSFGRHLRDVERRIFGGKFVTHKKHPFLGYLLRIVSQLYLKLIIIVYVYTYMSVLVQCMWCVCACARVSVFATAHAYVYPPNSEIVHRYAITM